MARRSGEVRRALTPQGQTAGQGLMQGGMAIRRGQGRDGRLQRGPVRGGRHQGPHRVPEADDCCPVPRSQGADPLRQGRADAVELGRGYGAGDVHQEQVGHPVLAGRKGLHLPDLRGLGPHRRLKPIGANPVDQGSGLVTHLQVDPDVAPLRRGLGDQERRRWARGRRRREGGEQQQPPEDAGDGGRKAVR
jgi:hypothetical protein